VAIEAGIARLKGAIADVCIQQDGIDCDIV
jgi:hypothetical protein